MICVDGTCCDSDEMNYAGEPGAEGCPCECHLPGFTDPFIERPRADY